MIKQVVISVFSLLLFVANLDAQNIECVNNRIEIPLTGFKAGLIQWQFSSDLSNWIDIENQTTENLTFNIQETGYIRAQVIDNSCSYYSDTNYIQVYPYPTPSEAGSDININYDTLTVKLSANTPSIGIGVWSIVSGEGGSFVDSTDAETTFSGQHCTNYTLRYNITTPCSNSSDDVVIGFHQEPTVANAGLDQSYDYGITSVTLEGNIPEEGHGTGYWSVLSGEGGSFVDSLDAGAVFNGQHCTEYTLRWTITTPCENSFDDVIITFNQVPSVANAGPDQFYDDGTTSVTLEGNIPEEGHGTGYWSIVSGEGGSFIDSTDAGTVFNGESNVLYSLEWTINTSCSFSMDEVIIIFADSISDIEGNKYPTVIIGNQLWMAENLKTTQYNDGTDIPLVTDNAVWIELTKPGYCWYENDQVTYGNSYGALYNWYTVEKGNLCPSDWHVPTDSEWTQLTDYLGGESVAASKLKEIGTTHWNSPNTDATNESGFTALPGGHRYKGNFGNIGSFGTWWSNTERSTSDAWYRYMSHNGSAVMRGSSFGKKTGFSVRCVKDE